MEFIFNVWLEPGDHQCGGQMTSNGRWQPLDASDARPRKVEDLVRDLWPAVDVHRLILVMMHCERI